MLYSILETYPYRSCFPLNLFPILHNIDFLKYICNDLPNSIRETKKSCCGIQTELKGYLTQTNWPIPILLHNTTNQPCNLGQHSAKKTPAMQHRSQGQLKRDLIQVRPLSQRGKGVRGEKKDGRKHELHCIISFLNILLII